MPQVSPSAGTTASLFAAPSPFECGWKLDALGAAWVRVGGELDLSTVPAFRETLREAQHGRGTVSIDLHDLEFIDCAALGVIVDADALARRQGHSLILVRSTGQVDRVLALTGLLEEVEVVDPRPFPAPS